MVSLTATVVTAQLAERAFSFLSSLHLFFGAPLASNAKYFSGNRVLVCGRGRAQRTRVLAVPRTCGINRTLMVVDGWGINLSNFCLQAHK